MNSSTYATALVLMFSLCLFTPSYSARILASVPSASYSHQVVFRPIWRELAKRGHEIVLITTDPMEDVENIRQIDMSFSYGIMKNRNYDLLVTKAKESPIAFFEQFLQIFIEISFEQLKHPEVQNLIHNKSEKFDLLMIESVLPIHLGFVEIFHAPVIGLSSFDVSNKFHEIMGNEAHPILFPDTTVVPYFHPLTLKQRAIILLHELIAATYGKYTIEAELASQLRAIFGAECRPLMGLFEEIDMLFMNSNPILHSVRALAPNTIQFGGGFHLENATKSLPEDLKTYLDNAENGVIYFSLGSNVKSYMLNDHLRQVLLETFSELPYRILWKFENEDLPNKPQNVWISKWFPQGDIFRHPNIKLFITQCGLQSIEEAIMNHIPMVGIPFIADQPANAKILENKGLGLQLDYDLLTKKIFKEAIEEVIHNSKYKRNVINIAELLGDVEMKGIEKVVWWTEYVIRNRGTKFFKNTSLQLPFYQYYLIDVILFIVSVVLGFVLIIHKLISLFINLKCKNAKKNKDS
ncbi:hypothetical protein WA026_005576 [Henosepilachna vigintioctopunctata]|uniref:Glucuronosyltransferase n=1 Tax=Henosepilachna vigintioctopunctata TaxID=420089 RepID=A0AAW1U5X2_9CUCU